MNTLLPPSETSIRPGPRMITPPRISSNQAAVASGSELRIWTWSQVTIGIVGLPVIFQAFVFRRAGNLAAARPHGYPVRLADSAIAVDIVRRMQPFRHSSI